MLEQDIIDRIKLLCQNRGWTNYRLAKESGITYSTLCTMLNKASYPSIPTLLKLCSAFGITLSQFFGPEEDPALLSDAQMEHLRHWNSLSEKNQSTADTYIQFLLAQQNEP